MIFGISNRSKAKSRSSSKPEPKQPRRCPDASQAAAHEPSISSSQSPLDKLPPSSLALFNALNVPAPPPPTSISTKKSKKKKSNSNCSQRGRSLPTDNVTPPTHGIALERLLSGKSVDPNYTPIVKSKNKSQEIYTSLVQLNLLVAEAAAKKSKRDAAKTSEANTGTSSRDGDEDAATILAELLRQQQALETAKANKKTQKKKGHPSRSVRLPKLRTHQSPPTV